MIYSTPGKYGSSTGKERSERDAKERENWSHKAFDLTAIQEMVRMIWEGGLVWGWPGTGFDVDTLENNSWRQIIKAIEQGKLQIEPWTAGMCISTGRNVQY